MDKWDVSAIVPEGPVLCEALYSEAEALRLNGVVCRCYVWIDEGPPENPVLAA